jgi:hypothetical protein
MVKGAMSETQEPVHIEDGPNRCRWRSRGHTRGNPKTCQPDLITAGSDQNVRGLDVFVNQLTLMHMFECRGETDGNPEDTRYLYRSMEQPVERFSSRMPEDKHLLTVVV